MPAFLLDFKYLDMTEITSGIVKQPAKWTVYVLKETGKFASCAEYKLLNGALSRRGK